MSTVHIMRGLPASGKSTLARELVLASSGRMRRVNLDELRAMLDPGTARDRKSREHEETVLAIQDAAVVAAIEGGFDICVDNTHLVSNIPNRIKRVVAGRAVFEVHDLTDVPVEECIRRDAARPNSVGEETIRSMAKRLGKWRLTAEHLNDVAMPRPYVPDTTKPKAVIFDIDGTLALSGHHRGPYDFDRCEYDALNEPVAQALNMYAAAGFRVILLSGRSSEYREHTLRWLAKMDLAWHDLVMRAEADRRSDDIVKAELFDEHVRARFNCVAVYDDRDRVVALWRRLGLTCMQVAYGNF